MNNQQHPITPPEDLLQQLRKLGNWQEIITKAYQAGADQELEACVEWLGDAPVVYDNNSYLHPGSYLRDARRPKPSLKEQALALLDKAEDPSWDINDFSILRQALEALPND